MTRPALTTGLLAVAFAVAVPASAQFMAADLFYLPVSAHSDGENDSRWRSNLYITNVADTDVDVALAYLPTGGNTNASVFLDRSTWLGGTEDDGFGFVDEALANIPPRGTVVLTDPIGEYWVPELGVPGTGAIVLFAYESGTLEDDSTRVNKNVILTSRIYNKTTIWVPDEDNEGEFIEENATYGQTMPGVPWYALVNSSAAGEEGDFTFQILGGGRQNNRFRYNLGIVNASDPQTTITLNLQPFQGDGEPFLDTSGNQIVRQVLLLPAAQVQYANVLDTLFGLGKTQLDVTVRVTFTGWTSSGSSPMPRFACYGSYIDNRSNDPTTILPSFAFPIDTDLLWGTDGGGGAKSRVSAERIRRPVELPPR
jgi:hypothetical protein